jgi:hypothetical protein
MPTKYPHISASIALDGSKSVGTLGGYVEIDGEIIGITNHYVPLGAYRIEAFPTAEEESTSKTYIFLQPAATNLQKRNELCEQKIRLESVAEDIEKL